MQEINGLSKRQRLNAPHAYAPYVIYPQDGVYGMAYHVRGPGSIELYPWPTRDAAENYAFHMQQVFDKGGVIEEAGKA